MTRSGWFRAISATLLLLAGAATAPLAAPDEAAAPGGTPVAVFPTFVHDFGEVGRGDRLTYDFIVRNEGTAPLEIIAVHPT